jgi:hypothetical protein
VKKGEFHMKSEKLTKREQKLEFKYCAIFTHIAALTCSGGQYEMRISDLIR